MWTNILFCLWDKHLYDRIVINRNNPNNIQKCWSNQLILEEEKPVSAYRGKIIIIYRTWLKRLNSGSSSSLCSPGPFKEEVNILSLAFLKPCAAICFAWEVAFLSELMITQHNVLLMEMLFLGSMLIIIIVTNLAWEPVSQDL